MSWINIVFDETSLPEKKEFYSSLNIEDITYVIFKSFINKNLGDYQDIFMFQVLHYYLQIYFNTLETVAWLAWLALSAPGFSIQHLNVNSLYSG